MSRRRSCVLCFLLLLVAVAADVPPRDGTATFTDLTGGGACSFPGEPPDNLHVGISSAEFGAADVCGAYLDVVGPRGSVRVKVTDHCRRCAAGLIDVTRKAFSRIADLAAGRAPVSYRLARNPPLRDPISLRVSAGSSPWWFQLQVLDHGNALRSVELSGRPLVHTADNWWRASNPGPGDGPFVVRITDVYGQSVTVYDVPLAPGTTHHTVARLYQPAPPASAPTSTSTTTTSPESPSPDSPSATPDEQPAVAAPPPASAPRPAGRTGDDGALASVFVVLAALGVAARIYTRRRSLGRLHPLQRLRQARPR